MDHQDWKQVVLRKATTRVSPSPNLPPKEKDLTVDGPDKKITSELRGKLVAARGSTTQKELLIRAGQLGVRGLSQKDIQDAEGGKCTLKEGKRIALAYQKVLRVKIL